MSSEVGLPRAVRRRSSPEELFKIAFVVVFMAAAFAALGLAGWFGQPWSAGTAALIALLGAAAAGAIEGDGVRGRALAAIPHAIGASVFVIATAWYASGRSEIIVYELLIPAAVAALPFLAARWGVRRATRRMNG